MARLNEVEGLVGSFPVVVRVHSSAWSALGIGGLRVRQADVARTGQPSDESVHVARDREPPKAAGSKLRASMRRGEGPPANLSYRCVPDPMPYRLRLRT